MRQDLECQKKVEKDIRDLRKRVLQAGKQGKINLEEKESLLELLGEAKSF